jgi:hypothetical protein
MAIVPLPLSQDVQARALLHHLLEHGDIVGGDATGRTIIQLAVDDRVLETLMMFDAEAAELEPEPDGEEDGPPVVLELARPKVVRGKQARASAQVG